MQIYKKLVYDFLRNRCFRPKMKLKSSLRIALCFITNLWAKQTGLVTESNVAYQENVQT